MTMMGKLLSAPVGNAAACFSAKRIPELHPSTRRWQCAAVPLKKIMSLAVLPLRSPAATQLKTTNSWAAPRRRPLPLHASSSDSAPPSGGNGKILTLPTLLTLARVAAIPALIAAWFTQQWTLCAALFLGAAVTDYLDGYLARKMNASSAFGAFLDPVADKLMVATVLILMGLTPVPAGPLAGNTWLFPVLACIIIGREITMSALREWAAALGPEAHRAVAVSWTGKWKTASQMGALTLLLGAKMPEISAATAATAGAAGVALLGVAAALTVWSLIEYFAALWKWMA